MHLFRGLEGNRVNLFEKVARTSEKHLLSGDLGEAVSEPLEVKAHTATRLSSLDKKPKRKEKENYSLTRIKEDAVSNDASKRMTGLYRVKEEEEPEVVGPSK